MTGCRVNRITVTMEVYHEFEGEPHPVSFSYIPEPDDPLVAAAFAKNDAMLREAMARAGVAEIGLA